MAHSACTEVYSAIVNLRLLLTLVRVQASYKSNVLASHRLRSLSLSPLPKSQASKFLSSIPTLKSHETSLFSG